MHFFLYLRKVTDPKGSVLNEAVKLEGEEKKKEKKKVSDRMEVDEMNARRGQP